MPHAEAGHAVSSAPGTDLAQLVEVERELEQRLVRAQDEAAAVLAAAQAEAENLTRAGQREDDAARVQVQARLEQERAEQEAAILAAGRTRATWYDELPASTLSELAGVVLDRLLREDHP